MNKIIFYDSKRTNKIEGIISTMKFFTPQLDFVIVDDVNALGQYYSTDRNILGYPTFVMAQAIVTDEKVPYHGIPVFPIKDAARALNAKPAFMRTSQYVVKRYTFLNHLGLFKNSGDVNEHHLGDLTYFTKGTILCIKDLHKPLRIQYTHHFSNGEFWGLITLFNDDHTTRKVKFSYSVRTGITLMEPDFEMKPYFHKVSHTGSCHKVIYIDLPDFTIGSYK